MAYVYYKKSKDDENIFDVKLFDIFNKRVLDKDKFNISFEIVCINYFKKKGKIFIVTIDLGNNLTIYDTKENVKIEIKNIGTNFSKFNKNNFFSLSTVYHQNDFWIITSYNNDSFFKIFNSEGIWINKINLLQENSLNSHQNIISLQSLYISDANAYICVRTEEKISLYINENYIRDIKVLSDYEDCYLNFKMLYHGNFTYVLISSIKKDLTRYSIDIYEISNIFSIDFNEISNEFSITNYFKNFINRLLKSIFINIPFNEMNEEIQDKILNNIPKNVIAEATERQKTNLTFELENKNSNENNIIEKFNIGNILFWEKTYIIVGTPFNYLDVIDFKKGEIVGKISDAENIIPYNISEVIDDPEYGESFIMRDNKGKIQYIRPAIIKDKLNYKIIQSQEFFNELPDEKKLKSIKFSMFFYLLYGIISYSIPLVCGIISFKYNKKIKHSLFELMVYNFYFYYICFGLCCKGCIYDIYDNSNSLRKCVTCWKIIFLLFKIAGHSVIAYRYCSGNKNGFIFICILEGMFLLHFISNFIIYCCKIKFILKKYWLNFLFYQISRFSILLFFILCHIFNVNNFETYIFAFILSLIAIYIFMVNYFNTLLFKGIFYSNYLQAVFNFPFEWMNLCCICCGNPKNCFKKIDEKVCCNYCSCCNRYCESYECYKFQKMMVYVLMILFVFLLIPFLFLISPILVIIFLVFVLWKCKKEENRIRALQQL